MKKSTMLLTLVVLNHAYYACAAIPDAIRQTASQCGIDSLYFCLCYLNLNPSLTQMYADITPNEDYQVSLQQLAQYARQRGATVWAVRHPTLSILKKYLNRDSCVIVQFQHGDRPPHMVSLLKPNDRRVLYTDAPRRRFVASESTLEDILSHSDGLLVLSARPIRASLFDRTDKRMALWIGISAVGLGLLGVGATLAWNKIRIPHIRGHARSAPDTEGC